MNKKKMARMILVCIIAISIIVVITTLPSCQSPPSKPVLVTYNCTDQTTTSLKAQGEVTDDGRATITRRGFYYDTGSLYGLEFDGENDYVNCGNGTSLDITAEITIEAWVKDVSQFAWSDIAGRRYSTNYQLDYGIGTRNDGTNQLYRFQVTDSAGKQWETAICLAEINSEWHHVAGTFDGRYLKFYFDGELKQTTDTEAQRNIATSGYNLLMGDWFGQKLNATISDIHIWNIARSESEIQTDMYKELEGIDNGLVGYWKFNEGSGTIAHDSSGNDNHGTLVGDPGWFIGGGIMGESGEFGTGTYSLTIEDLVPDTWYRIMAFAENELGTGYGNVVTCKTSAA